MTRQRGILDRDAPAAKYSREEVLASYDFCIAALEEEQQAFGKALAILKEHRAKLLPSQQPAYDDKN